MRRAPLTVACLLATTGCYASDGLAPAPATADLACGADALALAWGGDSDAWAGAYHPVVLAVGPGPALLLRRSYFDGQVVRMRDGAPIAAGVFAAMDDAWRRSIEVDAETATVIVRDVASGEPVRTIEPSPIDAGWTMERTAVLSRDGGTALVLQCGSHAARTDPQASLRAIDLATGTETRVALVGACAPAWAPGAPQLHAIEGGAIVVGMRAPGAEIDEETGAWLGALGVARVDLASARTTLVFPVDPSIIAAIDGPAPHIGGVDPVILAAAVTDDELAIVARDGMLRRLDLATLAPIAEPMRVPIFSANWDTYMPSVESPVAYSTGGALLAHVSGETTITIRSTETGEPVATLELPFAARPDGGVPPPMAMRFVPDGLVVSTSHGVARYGCGGEAAPVARPEGELSVRAHGPASMRLGEPIAFRVDVERATLPVVRTIEIGSTLPRGSFGPDVLAYSYEAGTWDVEAIADDGVREARVTSRIAITE